MIGVPVKDYNSQSTMFTLCILGLAEGTPYAWHKGQRRLAVTFVLLGIVFLASILYAATSRTALVALPILLVLFALMRPSRKSAVGLIIALMVFLVAAWQTSPRLRERVTDFFDEVRYYQPTGVPTPAGGRLEFWRKSLIIVADAPFFGHGTGSIQEQFRKLATGQTGMAGLVTGNPHNQIFAIAIQLGLMGTLALFAMWIAHLFFFCGPGLLGGSGLLSSCKTSSARSSTLRYLIRRMAGFTSWASAFSVEWCCATPLEQAKKKPSPPPLSVLGKNLRVSRGC